ncbi:Cytochrome b-c1 complex subunit 6 [Zea mays]|uniref:Complex III subunit VI n=1 Tax=Zea mays TaxID=4577 RepID=A0A1D6QMJ8_MAIZE|nr:Cytochrome b-c1 complex subunit 6 [Zea mays]
MHAWHMSIFVQTLTVAVCYQKCVKRVENDDTGHKHCTGQYFDYWSCIDKCVASKLFKKLK